MIHAVLAAVIPVAAALAHMPNGFGLGGLLFLLRGCLGSVFGLAQSVLLFLSNPVERVPVRVDPPQIAVDLYDVLLLALGRGGLLGFRFGSGAECFVLER